MCDNKVLFWDKSVFLKEKKKTYNEMLIHIKVIYVNLFRQLM